jgi:hypothetical protein
VKKTKCHLRESISRTGAYIINLFPTLLTVELHRHIMLLLLSEYDSSARHEELKRKMFGALGGGDVGRLSEVDERNTAATRQGTCKWKCRRQPRSLWITHTHWTLLAQHLPIKAYTQNIFNYIAPKALYHVQHPNLLGQLHLLVWGKRDFTKIRRVG